MTSPKVNLKYISGKQILGHLFLLLFPLMNINSYQLQTFVLKKVTQT